MTDRRTELIIDTKAVKSNYSLFSPDGAAFAVVKADAYGLGARAVCRALTVCRRFAVATADEAKSVARVRPDSEVLILGDVPPADIKTAVGCGAVIPVGSAATARRLSDITSGVSVAISVDTGMHRDGVWHENIAEIIKIFNTRGVNVKYIFSHLRGGENEIQAERLRILCAGLSRRGYNVPVSLPATYAALECGGIPRIGIGLYGIGAGMPDGIKCAVSWRARISRIAEVKSGDFIGYGHTYRADEDMRIATVSAGYADGVFRSLSNAGQILIGGKKCDIVGTVCMDMLTADVTDVHCSVGGAATLIGTDGDESITFADMAQTAGTIEYEISARVGARVPRIYR